MELLTINVEELSENIKQGRTVVVQEADTSASRQWTFTSGKLASLREENLEESQFPSDATVILIGEDDQSLHSLASSIRQKVANVFFLNGGHFAWGHYYHPSLVGFDDDVHVWQIYRLSKGCLSYIIVSNNRAIVVDPSLHIDFYTEFCQEKNATIAMVMDTELHRDHVSGAPLLATTVDCSYYAPEHDDLKASYTPLNRQTDITIASIRLKAISLAEEDVTKRDIAFLVNDRYLLTGNHSLQSHTLTDTWSKLSTLQQLPQDTILLPAHVNALGFINQHGLIATTIEQIQEQSQTKQLEKVTASSEPPARESEIYRINATQETVNLDQATELELGRQS